LKRPPTLLTTASSRSSSSILVSLRLGQDITDPPHRFIHVVINDLVAIPVGQSQFASGFRQSPPNCRKRIEPPPPQGAFRLRYTRCKDLRVFVRHVCRPQPIAERVQSA